jgi:NAD(P)H-hydrate epimerase
MTFVLQGKPVVTVEEMARLEKLAYDAGIKEIAFMEQAGRGVAQAVIHYVQVYKLKKVVVLLLGKGNKAGDGFTAALELLKEGFQVAAYALYPQEEWSPLCQEQGKKFGAAASAKELHFQGASVIIDALLGTGFHGKAEGEMAACIEAANRSGLPIFSIDLPSGLNGSTGEAQSVAIRATQTVAVGLPKVGLFIQDGWNMAGKVALVDFGLSAKARASYYLLDDGQIPKALPAIKRTRHKYEAGYLLAVAGSPGMSGAALLACFAALRTGAGIVRLFHPEGMELDGAPLELLKEEWDLENNAQIVQESKRAKALLIGPGMGRSKKSHQAVVHLLQTLSLPCVVDADALFVLAEDPAMRLPPHTVLTPHKQEMARLLGSLPLTHEACQRYAEEKEVTLVLKGAPTFIFHPQEKPLIIPQGDPGMATAGMGDVLTGMIGSFLAQGCDARTAACLGAACHGLAGELVAAHKGSQGMIATDLIQELPCLFQFLRKRSNNQRVLK